MEPAAPESQIDWRLRLSMGLTFGWLVLGVVYITSVVGWRAFAQQAAPSLGSFLEGAFAPLAFLWLVVGFFLQQQQLSENTRTIQAQLEQLRITALHAETQARAIAADELHSRQDTFLRLHDLVSDQLGLIAGWIVTSYDAGTENIIEIWRRHGSGESTAFSLELLRRCGTGEVEAAEIFYGTPIRRGHAERFIATFDRLVQAGDPCDPNGLIVSALHDGTHGRVARMMRESDPTAVATE